MPKEMKGKRIERMDLDDYSPLTQSDLRTLRSFIVSDDKPLKVDRAMLARFVLDRERLLYVVSCAGMRRSLLREADLSRTKAIEEGSPELAERAEEQHARAEALLDRALDALEGAGEVPLCDPIGVVRQMLRKPDDDDATIEAP